MSRRRWRSDRSHGQAQNELNYGRKTTAGLFARARHNDGDYVNISIGFKAGIDFLLLNPDRNYRCGSIQQREHLKEIAKPRVATFLKVRVTCATCYRRKGMRFSINNSSGDTRG